MSRIMLLMAVGLAAMCEASSPTARFHNLKVLAKKIDDKQVEKFSKYINVPGSKYHWYCEYLADEAETGCNADAVIHINDTVLDFINGNVDQDHDLAVDLLHVTFCAVRNFESTDITEIQQFFNDVILASTYYFYLEDEYNYLLGRLLVHYGPSDGHTNEEAFQKWQTCAFTFPQLFHNSQASASHDVIDEYAKGCVWNDICDDGEPCVAYKTLPPRYPKFDTKEEQVAYIIKLLVNIKDMKYVGMRGMEPTLCDPKTRKCYKPKYSCSSPSPDDIIPPIQPLFGGPPSSSGICGWEELEKGM